MNIALLLAAALTVLVVVAHSYLGERYLLIPLFRRENLPRLRGSADFTRRTLRLAWHITSVFGFALAGLLVALAWGKPASSGTSVLIIAMAFAGSGLVSLLFSRGRHLSWIAFFIIAALTWFGHP